MTEKFRRYLSSPASMVTAALALRLLVVALFYQGQLNPRHDHWPFGYETGRIARAIASGRGFSDVADVGSGPTAWMTPLYPYLAAGVFKLFGIYSATSAVILLGLNGLFSGLTCVPVFLMARESFGDKVAGWAGWTWALYPFAISVAAEWIWETCLTTLLLSWIFVLTLRLQRTTRFAAWSAYGLLWGLASLSNPAVVSLLPFLAGWACFRLHQRGERWSVQALAALAVLSVVVTPWFVRNYRTFHIFIPFRQPLWLALYFGNNDQINDWATDITEPMGGPREEQEYVRLGELKYMAQKREESLDYIRRKPSLFVWRSLRRFVLTWTGFWSLPARGGITEAFDPDLPFDPAIVALSTAVSVLAITGLIRAFRLGVPAAWPYAFVLLVFPSIYYLTVAHLRFRHPIDPELVVLAISAFGARPAEIRGREFS